MKKDNPLNNLSTQSDRVTITKIPLMTRQKNWYRYVRIGYMIKIKTIYTGIMI